MKMCTKCNAVKPIEAFPQKGGGRRHAWCKACLREYGKAWYRRNAVRHREQTRLWKKQHPMRVRAYRQRWYEEHPEKRHEEKARRVNFNGRRVSVPLNLRLGKCGRCGRVRRPEERQFHLHHTRYDRWHPYLYTIELCPACHNWVTRHSVRRKIDLGDGRSKWFNVISDEQEPATA